MLPAEIATAHQSDDDDWGLRSQRCNEARIRHREDRAPFINQTGKKAHHEARAGNVNEPARPVSA